MMIGGANLVSQDRKYWFDKIKTDISNGHQLLKPGGKWPGRWRDGGCAVWMGRDGKIAPVEQLGKFVENKRFAWLYDTHDFTGAPFEVPGEGGEPDGLTFDELLGGEGRDGGTMMHIGAGDFIVLNNSDYKASGSGADWQWCGNNPGEDFIVPPGIHAPHPVDIDQKCYTIRPRCYRMLLVQNAQWAGEMGDGKKWFDFSKASVRWARDTCSHKREYHLLQDNGRDEDEVEGWRFTKYPNGERPLKYPTEGHVLNLAHYGTVFDDVTAFCNRDVYLMVGKNAVGGSDSLSDHSRIAHDSDGFLGDEVPSFEYKSFGKPVEVHYRIWRHSPDAAASEHVIDALTSVADVGRRIMRFSDPTSENKMPFPYGTAFDMLLVCWTYYWRQYEAFMTRPGGWRPQFCWVKTGAMGYVNTRIAGYMYQLSPTPPAA